MIGPLHPDSMAIRGVAGLVQYGRTDSRGELLLSGIMRGSLLVTLLSPVDEGISPPGRPFVVEGDGQILEFQLEVGGPSVEFVPVVGRISPIPAFRGVALLSLSEPLPHPMDGREMRALGIATSLVSGVEVVGGAFRARMNPHFPYLAIRIDDELGLYDNAGYLVSIGGLWRADLVIPTFRDKREAKLIVTAPTDYMDSLRLQVIWRDRGRLGSHDKYAVVGREVPITWPGTADRVWVIATARSNGGPLAALMEPQADLTNSLSLEVMPEVRVINTEGLEGFVALTPEGIGERKWVSLESLGNRSLPLFGSGRYEFAGMVDGKVRTQIVTVVSGRFVPVLELDARTVLSGQ
jgi:hypothetical protein